MEMRICPICHGNGFVACPSGDIIEYADTPTDKQWGPEHVSLSWAVKGCDRCMNRGEISD
jgi:hypothetical protein